MYTKPELVFLSKGLEAIQNHVCKTAASIDNPRGGVQDATATAYEADE